MDVKSACLNGKLVEPVYRSVFRRNQRIICELDQSVQTEKALNGLKQSWSMEISEVVVEISLSIIFVRSEVDLCIYFIDENYFLIYIVLFSGNKNKIIQV